MELQDQLVLQELPRLEILALQALLVRPAILVLQESMV